MTNHNLNSNIEIFKNYLKNKNINCYIINTNDNHQSEYPSTRWKTIEWLTGFTGSYALLLYLNGELFLWTDSRYYIQAELELRNKNIKIMKDGLSDTKSIFDIIELNIKDNDTIAFDGKTITIDFFNKLQSSLKYRNIKYNFSEDLNELWKDRPSFPEEKCFILDPHYSCIDYKTKIQKIRDYLTTNNVDYYFSVALDDNAYLLNIRGEDIKYNPFVYCFLLISNSEVILFINKDKLLKNDLNILTSEKIIIKDYNEIETYLKNIEENKKIILISSKTGIYYKNLLKCQIIEKEISYIAELKSIKSETEIENIKIASTKDGIALCEFFYNLEKNLKDNKSMNEYSLSELLKYYRKKQSTFFDCSFESIVGFKENSAIVHYSPDKNNSKSIDEEGALLIDSGGHYLYGTTDITRTIYIGNKVPAEFKKLYTLVLKGVINLASLKFPENTKGYQIDAFARKYLWEQGLDYGHSTGHGIGNFLCVHEFPPHIGQRPSNSPLKAGMIVTIEPGIYIENKFGIRIENMALIKQNKHGFLEFELITYFPIFTSYVNKKLLNKKEIDFINNFNKTVFKKLSNHLNKELKSYLKKLTKPI